MFVDTYYKGKDNLESVDFYAEQVRAGGPSMDPLAAGRYDANRPIWKPREYFVRVLECRVEQVKQEWHNVVSRVLQRIEPHVSADPAVAV